MLEADFHGAAVSCAQALALDKARTYPTRQEIEDLESEAEHKRTAQVSFSKTMPRMY